MRFDKKILKSSSRSFASSESSRNISCTCVAVSSSELQCVAACVASLPRGLLLQASLPHISPAPVLQRVAVSSSELQCVAVCVASLHRGPLLRASLPGISPAPVLQ